MAGRIIDNVRLVATPNEPTCRRRSWVRQDGVVGEVDEKRPYALDAMRTISSKTVGRRLPDKTQVYGPDRGTHVRTRFSHSADVAEAVRMACIMLGLNDDLGEALAWVHDGGHTPFGHIGEQVLSVYVGAPVEHANLSCLIMQHVESRGRGLNLDGRVLHGVAYHSCSSEVPNLTPEAELLRILDKVAYLSGDANDTIRANEQGVFEFDKNVIDEMSWRARHVGANQHQFVKHCINELVAESRSCGYVSFETSELAKFIWDFRSWMYENIYSKIDWSREVGWLHRIYEFFVGFGEFEGCDPALLVALLTDKEARMLGQLIEDGLGLSANVKFCKSCVISGT